MELHDPQAFQTVYAAHSRRVYANAYRILGDAAKAEDTVQDVFLRLWLHPDRFDERRGDLGSYLALMARSRALDLARSESAGARASDRLTAAVEADPPQAERPDERVEARERSKRLRTAVGRLPKLQREAVALAFWGDLPAREIASRTGVPLGTARSRLRLGIEKLGQAALERHRERSDRLGARMAPMPTGASRKLAELAVGERLQRDAVVRLAHPELVGGPGLQRAAPGPAVRRRSLSASCRRSSS